MAKKTVKKASKKLAKPSKVKAKAKIVKSAKPAPQKLAQTLAKNVKAAVQKPVPAVVKKKQGKEKEVAQQLAAQFRENVVVEEVRLTNAEGKHYCRAHDCDSVGVTEGYCRFHYLSLWKRNRTKTKILEGGKLDKYIEELTNKYPDRYLEMLRKDLANEKDFTAIVAEMDVEDSNDEAESTEEDTGRFIEEVRGTVPTDDDDGGF